MPFKSPIGGLTVSGSLTLADEPFFWPCKTGEADAPTLSSAVYSTSFGQPNITPNGSNFVITWATLPRYGKTGARTLRVVCLVNWPNQSFATGFRLGYDTAHARLIQNGSTTNTLDLGDYNTGNGKMAGSSAALDVRTLKGTWVKIALTYSPTLTQLQVNDDPALIATGPPLLDSFITVSGFRAQGQASTTGYPSFSNLSATHS